MGWLLASTLSPPIARVQSLPERPSAVAAAAAESAFDTQLRLRLEQLPEPPRTRRNPFSFGTRAAAPRADRAAAPAAPTPLDPAPLAPPAPAPSLSLAGIGVSADGLTAVLTDGHAVIIVKPGDHVGGSRVADITEQHVTLVDDAGRARVLRLP